MSNLTEWCFRLFRVIRPHKTHASMLDSLNHAVQHHVHTIHAVHSAMWQHKVFVVAKACAFICIPIFGGAGLYAAHEYRQGSIPYLLPYGNGPMVAVPEPSTLWLFAAMMLANYAALSAHKAYRNHRASRVVQGKRPGTERA